LLGNCKQLFFSPGHLQQRDTGVIRVDNKVLYGGGLTGSKSMFMGEGGGMGLHSERIHKKC
jgi:hypothetical protein